ALVVIASESTKHLLRHIVRRAELNWRWEFALSLALLGALLVYHNDRIERFIKRTASREFFLTEDLEHLRDWLRQHDHALGDYTPATASHELNHLCAYWTRADLMLPEGFPHF